METSAVLTCPSRRRWRLEELEPVQKVYAGKAGESGEEERGGGGGRSRLRETGRDFSNKETESPETEKEVVRGGGGFLRLLPSGPTLFPFLLPTEF